jgi:large subunit ribosomal protein L2
MGVRNYRPTSAGRRSASVSDFAELTPGAKPEKSLLKPLRKKGGRNNQGKITVRHRGGGHKRMYREVDFRREKDGVPANVDSIQYDPNRSGRIALLHYIDGEKRYILAPDGLKAGDRVENGPDAAPSVGNCLPLKRIPLGTEIHCIEMLPGQGARLCRSAGTSATLVAREAGWAQITLPSGEIRRVPAACRATIGKVSNPDHMSVRLGKAGRKRWLGRRPHVRGTAMNPIDHPHGGGEGRTKGGRHPVSPTGKLAKGGATRKKRKPSNTAIVRRRWSRRYGQLKLPGK